jgi:hypothetical protein
MGSPLPDRGRSRAHRSVQPATALTPRTPTEVESQILDLRRSQRLGPARIAGILGVPASTVYRVLSRHHEPRLAWLDRPTGQPIRRYEPARPGELVHVDVKKLGRLRDGGG